MADDALPEYQTMLGAYHRAFARELRAMIDVLPLEPGRSVIDMACGDGVYSPWLAERVAESGRVVAVDVSEAYLAAARATSDESNTKHPIVRVRASIDALPFPDDTFDLVWCAQSLYSLPEPVSALRRMARVVRPGGLVAVLENDTLHQVILPWPIEIELSVRAAELRAHADESDQPRKYYVGRILRRVLREAGLTRIEARTFATDRAGPLGDDERIYFAEYLGRLAERIAPFLDGAIRGRFGRLVDPASGGYLLDDPDFAATCIDHVVWGRKPG